MPKLIRYNDKIETLNFSGYDYQLNAVTFLANSEYGACFFEQGLGKTKVAIDLTIEWLNENKLVPRGKYTIKHTSKFARCIVKDIRYKIDVNTLHRMEDDIEIGLNDICRISIRTTQPLFHDKYRRNRTTGSIILIDEGTNETVGAGMII